MSTLSQLSLRDFGSLAILQRSGLLLNGNSRVKNARAFLTVRIKGPACDFIQH